MVSKLAFSKGGIPGSLSAFSGAASVAICLCAHPTETFKVDEMKQEKKKPSSFHLSYNYGLQQEPEVCPMFLKDRGR